MTTNENAPGLEGTGGAGDEQLGGGYVAPSIRHPYAAAVEMLAASAERERRIDRAAFEEGYRLGYEAGRDVGYQQAETDMETAWVPVAERVRRLGRSLTFAELEMRRWGGPREDFGKPRPGDHPGGPKQWNGTVNGRGTAA